ncbi:MAG TPA: ABC transporter ATP-binding protein [Steroidobacteraceae bacterium]
MAGAPPQPGPLLTLEALRKRYRPAGAWVLDGASLVLRTGEFLAILGESGSGKSTLLNLIAGLDRADSGRVLFDSIDFGQLDDDALTRLRRARIGFVFQAFHVLPYLTALQNVVLPLDLLEVPRAERRTRAMRTLEDCGIGALAERYPRELSGGELQRIAVARALVHRPALVLADEPTGNLDAASAAQVLTLMRASLSAGGAAAILITHSPAAARMADRIMHLENGRLAEPAP